ncbi:hypothetical protein PROFUN_12126 [Planoprotostelium fungivorum]|uniref:Uncharacterized protein n=1 Tax=Planoprotostelium fungivorum TaxID=1890364 RepID=A0A2P6N893_9EUKA|nr:hypothetical protein PROFUN_12126 [Planoprotostelium fungivorum]
MRHCYQEPCIYLYTSPSFLFRLDSQELHPRFRVFNAPISNSCANGISGAEEVFHCAVTSQCYLSVLPISIENRCDRSSPRSAAAMNDLVLHRKCCREADVILQSNYGKITWITEFTCIIWHSRSISFGYGLC